MKVSICVPSAATDVPSPHALTRSRRMNALTTSAIASFIFSTLRCRFVIALNSCADTPEMCRAASANVMLMPPTKVVSTYRPNGSFSFGSLPEAGPNRRHHSTQYAVRDRMPSRVRSGIRAFTSVSRASARALTPLARCLRSTGTPFSSMTRSALSGYPESTSAAVASSRSRKAAVKAAAVSGSPVSSHSCASFGPHSSQSGSWSGQLAKVSEPVMATPPGARPSR